MTTLDLLCLAVSLLPLGVIAFIGFVMSQPAQAPAHNIEAKPQPKRPPVTCETSFVGLLQPWRWMSYRARVRTDNTFEAITRDATESLRVTAASTPYCGQLPAMARFTFKFLSILPGFHYLGPLLFRSKTPSLRPYDTFKPKPVAGYEKPPVRDKLHHLVSAGFERAMRWRSSARQIFMPVTNGLTLAPLLSWVNMLNSLTTRVVGYQLSPNPILMPPVRPGRQPLIFFGQRDGVFCAENVRDMYPGLVVYPEELDPSIVVDTEAIITWYKTEHGPIINEAVIMLLPTPKYEVITNFEKPFRKLPTLDGRVTNESWCLEDGIGRLYEIFRRTHPWLPSSLEPVPLEEWLLRYPKWRRDELRKAAEENTGLPLLRDMKNTNFKKNEVGGKPVDVRNISPRHDRILVVVGPYVSSIDNAAHDCPYLIKGLTVQERDEKLQVLSQYRYVLEADQNRFDRHLNHTLLSTIETTFLQYPFQALHHAMFRNVIERCKEIAASSRCGTKYKLLGTRCSGDAHTSISNGEINAFCTWISTLADGSAMHGLFEGDDGIVGLKTDQAASATMSFALFGLSAKVSVRRGAAGSSFCGRILGDHFGSIISFCDPRRTLTKFHTTVSDKPWMYLLLAKALSYHHCDGKTPLIGPLTRNIILYLRPRLHRRKMHRYFTAAKRDLPWHFQNISFDDAWDTELVYDIDDETRCAFAASTGIPISQQLSAEREYEWFSQGLPPDVTPLDISWPDVTGVRLTDLYL